MRDLGQTIDANAAYRKHTGSTAGEPSIIMLFQALAGYGRRAGGVLRPVVTVGGILAFAAPSFAADATWPATVAAKYRLAFGGFDVGSYRFQSTSDGKTYSVNGNAEVSALFGAFTWKGGFESNGTVDATAPHPAAYKLDYKSKSKAVSIALGFDATGVKSVSILPKRDVHPDAVPIKPADLKSVFDPMSSILAMTHGTGGDPCSRTIPIFDGKARFNLVLSPKGEQRLKEDKPSGQPTQLKVCKVKYVPVSGHRPKDFVKPWVDYSGIEIALRPIPAANAFVPYRISIPTSIGAAVMSAESINITASNNTQIALTQ
jgi:Protein of unknown function (DUF3108)